MHIRGLWEETGRSDTRLLEALFLPDQLTFAGRSRALDGAVRREHVVPRRRVIRECIALLEANKSDADLARLIRRLVRIVHLTPQESARLDRPRGEGGVKQDMPSGWAVDGDIYARLVGEGISWEPVAPDDLPSRPEPPDMLEPALEMAMADDLYDQDFYLWTRAQAEALRAHAGASNVLDYDHLAEEVEDLGSAERNKAESLVRQIIVHFYKLSASRNLYPVNHWRGEILELRINLRRPLTRAIRRELEAGLESVHQDALTLAEIKMERYEPDVVIDGSLRWTLPQVLSEADDPLPPRQPR